MKPTLIIFDFDGTLCDTRHNIVLTFRDTAERLGLEPRTDEAFAATIGLTLYDGFRRLYPAMSHLEAEHCVDVYRAIFAEHRKERIPELFPAVRETLDELRRRGYRMSIASSRLSDSLRLFLGEHKLTDYFEFIVGSDSTTRHKPDAEPVELTLRHFGLAADEVYVVGDMPVDIAMAHNAGVRACGVTYGNATREELCSANADAVIDSFDSLLDVLE